MKIATWNVNGIRAREKQFLEWLERERPHVVCLQEIKAPPAQIPQILCEMQGYRCYWHGERAYSGVGLHVRTDAFSEPPIFTHPPFDYETRMVAARMGDLLVASIYVPNGGKDFLAKMRFLEALELYAEESHAAGLKLILCGDINITRTERDVHPKERNPRLVGQRPEEREMLERILARGLTDVGRALDPENDNLFTWWAPWRNMRQRNIGWRLDYILASDSIARHCKASIVQREVGTSDHAPVMIEIELPGEGRPANGLVGHDLV